MPMDPAASTQIQQKKRNQFQKGITGLDDIDFIQNYGREVISFLFQSIGLDLIQFKNERVINQAAVKDHYLKTYPPLRFLINFPDFDSVLINPLIQV